MHNILFEIVQTKISWLKYLKTLCSGHMLLVILTEKLLKCFAKNNCQKKKKNQKECKGEKVIKRKGDKLYVKWKGYDNYFNNWIDKKDSINEWIFCRTKTSGERRKFELDLYDYATKLVF